MQLSSGDLTKYYGVWGREYNSMIKVVVIKNEKREI